MQDYSIDLNRLLVRISYPYFIWATLSIFEWNSRPFPVIYLPPSPPPSYVCCDLLKIFARWLDYRSMWSYIHKPRWRRAFPGQSVLRVFFQSSLRSRGVECGTSEIIYRVSGHYLCMGREEGRIRVANLTNKAINHAPRQTRKTGRFSKREISDNLPRKAVPRAFEYICEHLKSFLDNTHYSSISCSSESPPSETSLSAPSDITVSHPNVTVNC